MPFPHLLFERVLSYSKWTPVASAVSETFEALVAGLRGALWQCRRCSSRQSVGGDARAEA